METWKDIPGYEGLYQASSLGQIKSVLRNEIMKQTAKTVSKRHLPYLQIRLSKNGDTKTFFVHRLVASAFSGPIQKGLVVRHLDDNPQNNSASNLKIGTQKENVNECIAKGRMKSDSERLRKLSPFASLKLKSAVIATNISTGEVIRFDGVRAAARVVGIKGSSNISDACKGKRKSVAGFIFKYDNDVMRQLHSGHFRS